MKERDKRADNTLKILDYLQANIPGNIEDNNEDEDEKEERRRKQHMSKLSRQPSSNSPF